MYEISPVEGGLGDCGVGVPMSDRLQRSASSHNSSANKISFSSTHTSVSSLKHSKFNAYSTGQTKQMVKYCGLPFRTRRAWWIKVLHFSCHILDHVEKKSRIVTIRFIKLLFHMHLKLY